MWPTQRCNDGIVCSRNPNKTQRNKKKTISIFFFFFCSFVLIFLFLYLDFFGRCDTSGSMIPLSVPEISPCGVFLWRAARTDGRTCVWRLHKAFGKVTSLSLNGRKLWTKKHSPLLARVRPRHFSPNFLILDTSLQTLSERGSVQQLFGNLHSHFRHSLVWERWDFAN